MLLVLGVLAHAPIDLKEQCMRAFDQCDFQALTASFDIQQVMWVRTCYRAEIYLEASSLPIAREFFLHACGHDLRLRERLHQWMFEATDTKMIEHALRVTCGLDSLVMGESEILGQMKSAYRRSIELGLMKKTLGRVFSFVFTESKKIRKTYQKNELSIASVAAMFVEHHCTHTFSDIDAPRVLCIGSGYMIQNFAKSMGVGLLFCNRTFEKAQTLAVRYQGHAVPWSQLEHVVRQAQVVVCATACSQAVVTSDMINVHAKQIFLDLSMPRNIETQVGDLLYGLKDLKEFRFSLERQDTHDAEQWIQKALDAWSQSKQAASSLEPLIRYREHAEQLCDRGIEQARRWLDTGKPASWVVEYMMRRLTHQLLHMPTVQFKEEHRNLMTVTSGAYALADMMLSEDDPEV